jgi:hypothetical protein
LNPGPREGVPPESQSWALARWGASSGPTSRPTEIDAITGTVVDYGEAAGVDVLENRLATDLVEGREYAATHA